MHLRYITFTLVALCPAFTHILRWLIVTIYVYVWILHFILVGLPGCCVCRLFVGCCLRLHPVYHATLVFVPGYVCCCWLRLITHFTFGYTHVDWLFTFVDFVAVATVYTVTFDYTRCLLDVAPTFAFGCLITAVVRFVCPTFVGYVAFTALRRFWICVTHPVVWFVGWFTFTHFVCFPFTLPIG